MRYTASVAKQNVSIRIEPSVLIRIEKAAGRENRSVSQWVALAAERALDVVEAEQARKAGRR